MGGALGHNFSGVTCTRCGYTKFTSQDFAYTGGVQSFTVPATGTYKLEVWGAQGSVNIDGQGLGGYATGTIQLTSGQTIYIVVGSQSGYNGGGSGWNGGGSGGGATHISTSNRGLLTAFNSYRGEVLIVAGGGGGGGWYGSAHTAGGSGGGTNGSRTSYNHNGQQGNCGWAATQTAPGGNLDSSWSCDDEDHPYHHYTAYVAGSFGRGGNGDANDECNGGYSGEAGGGGGGWYGGGGSSVENGHCAGGGGGSGYTGGVSNGTMSNGVQSGNGKAKISIVN